ncbi:Putative metallophosphoesterase [Sulfurovum sp. enrichment culture clone C5]|uniref:Putative metallophosphoesterase n=1 Tax=Sulfurovum sp. enrichment culture clone C5 TaxID=497650 RepID=A0A0S4XPA4_9BACT|nr:Putative metallophosphoesterase [Sulfurovum sp. enrichment culture clone C5]
MEIQEGAIFIADAHYPHHGDEFLELLKDIKSGNIKTSQLFLMGDIFDLLFGYNDYIVTFTHEAISLLQELSKTMQIHYFEGNHDFCLKDVFPDMHLYSRDEQPITMKIGEKKVSLSHGDRYDAGFGYGVYCKLLRNKITLNILKPFEKKIINHQMSRLPTKIICRKMSNFEQKAEAIMSHYLEYLDMVIEGHFHQAVKIGKYISLPSLACQKMYAVVKNGEIIFKSI